LWSKVASKKRSKRKFLKTSSFSWKEKYIVVLVMIVYILDFKIVIKNGCSSRLQHQILHPISSFYSSASILLWKASSKTFYPYFYFLFSSTTVHYLLSPISYFIFPTLHMDPSSQFQLWKKLIFNGLFYKWFFII